eukprot:6992385-Alexandrium_andersonii.AAC.1
MSWTAESLSGVPRICCAEGPLSSRLVPTEAESCESMATVSDRVDDMMQRGELVCAPELPSAQFQQKQLWALYTL